MKRILFEYKSMNLIVEIDKYLKNEHPFGCFLNINQYKARNIMKTKYKRAKCEILKLELESYLGNMVIREIYKKLINNNDKYVYIKELNYIEGNIRCIESFINRLPEDKKIFISDVYLENNLSMQQIMRKYKLNMSQYYRLIDKIIYENIEENESDSY